MTGPYPPRALRARLFGRPWDRLAGPPSRPAPRGTPPGEGQEGVHPAQLVAVQRAEPAEELLAAAGEPDPHGPGIVGGGSSPDPPPHPGPGAPPGGAVVAELQLLGELADDGPVPPREPLERQHELVLLRGDAVPPHRLLAEPQVAADTGPEPRQRLEVRLAQRFDVGHVVRQLG